MQIKLIVIIFVVIVGAGGYAYMSAGIEHGWSDSRYDRMGESDDRGGADEYEGGVDEYVLEYDADSADECDAGDTFNEENLTCEYICTDAAECEQLSEEAEEELGSWADSLEVAQEGVGEKPIADSELETVYTVTPGEKIVHVSGVTSPRDVEVWEQIAALSPDTFTAKYIETYGVFNDADNDTLAYVNDDDGNGKWLIVVNRAGYESSTPRERATTLVHELAHIVTLNKDQVGSDIEESECTGSIGFFTGEGCAVPGSYIGDFVAQFWTSADVTQAGGGAGQNETTMYNAKPDAFVTEYAATNPGEDIAESFALFVLDQRNATPQTIAEKKVAFFYAYPPLTSFRNEMRQALVTGIVRAKRVSR